MKQPSRGQGVTEYIIIVALIAIAAIGVVTIFGDSIRDLFGGQKTDDNGQAAPRTRTPTKGGERH